MVKSIINKSKKTHSKISVKEDNKKTSKPKVDIKKISKTAAETKEKPKIKN